MLPGLWKIRKSTLFVQYYKAKQIIQVISISNKACLKWLGYILISGKPNTTERLHIITAKQVDVQSMPPIFDLSMLSSSNLVL